MASWFLAPCLAQLRDEVDAAFPRRSKKSDGTIGDAAHSARTSQHNPNDMNDDVPNGAVTAIDITATNAALRAAVLKAAIGHPNCWYVINNEKIWSSTYDWEEQEYTGTNPHTDHIHVSCKQTAKAVKSTRSWLGGTASSGNDVKPPARVLPVLGRGDSHELVPVLKRFLGVKAHTDDPKFGYGLYRAVKRYQKMQGLTVDGWVGDNTWATILRALDLKGWKL
jgi:peptidoglycan hydrolase-like protein with peptidoglycan-binding domain